MSSKRKRGFKSRASKGLFYPLPDYHMLWATDVDQGLPVLEYTLSANAPTVIRKAKVFAEIRNNQQTYKCFFSGVDCFVGPREIFWSRNKFPWQATKEHLLSRLHHAHVYQKDWTRANFVLAGYRLNFELGHSPASMKVLVRRHLATKEYDRTDTLNQRGSFETVYQGMLDAMRGFTMYGKLPWHPQSYSLVNHRAAAHDFLGRINQMEREWFEQLTLENRFHHFDHTTLPIELI